MIDTSALAEEIANARWYGAKESGVSSVAEEDSLRLAADCSLHVLRIVSISGSVDHYLYVVGLDRVAGHMLSALSENRRAAGHRAEFRFEAEDSLAELMPVSCSQRPVDADQSNTTIVVGDRLTLKLYRRLEPGRHPEIELSHYLSNSVRDAFTPTFAGAVYWGECALGMAQAFIRNSADGWQWAKERVVEGTTEPFAPLGALTAKLHAALAGFESRTATVSDLRARRNAAEAQLERALELVHSVVPGALEAMAPEIRKEFAALDSAEGSALLTRIHGDYHVGQILFSPDGLKVIDFEGEPTRSLAERTMLDTPLRDVASMLRSFDHVARCVDHDPHPGRLPDIERWIGGVRRAFLQAYGPYDAKLLRALEIDKEVNEFVYAATFLPEWMYAPLAGMRWLAGERL